MTLSVNARGTENKRRVVKNLKQFKRREDGALTFFTCAMLFLMLMVCGIAVDLMQNEMTRTRVQNTLDRAILAAADLDQPLPSDEVIADHFAKAGMTEYLEAGSLTITPGANLPTTNYRIVEAEARTRTPAMYMAMTGVDSLPVYVAGMAEETVENTEISLVLDISGSMRNGGKIENLRVAAKQFIDAVLNGSSATTTSLNIVPYAGQTNPGPIVFARAGGTPFATYIEDEDGEEIFYGDTYTDEDGNTVSIAHNAKSSCLDLGNSDFDNIDLPSGGYQQTPHFMYWPINNQYMEWGWCPSNEVSIRYAQNNKAQLKQFIDDIRLHDGTGTQYGMKYGVALLNPSSQDTFQALNTAGIVPDEFADRPAPFDDEDTRKFIVLMTDGQITDQWRPTDRDHIENPDEELQGRPSSHRYRFSTRNTNVNNFYSVCDQAKAQGIKVYTIAFEAPSNAVTEMKNCATSPNYFYNVEGVEISSAFKAIARQINELRLTQ